MKRCVSILLFFVLVSSLFAGLANDQIIKRKTHSDNYQAIEKTYDWESGSTEFVSDFERDSRAVPNLIDYQGKITDSASNPITTSVSITFTIYDASTGGTNLWDETHLTVTPVDGLVHVLLGSETTFPTDLFNGSDRWLGIKVGGDFEMTPRLRIVSVPYAINADNLDGHDSDYFVSSIGDTMTGNLVVNTNSGTGISSVVVSTSGSTIGVRGSASGDGFANYGIYGEASGANSWAGYFDGDVHIEGVLQAVDEFRDSNFESGTSGQVLSSTGTGTDWIDATSTGATEINDLTDAKTGTSSVFIGSGSGIISTGSHNAFFGVDSGIANTSGLANTFIGRASGYSNTGGFDNTYLGYYSGLYCTGSSNVFLGAWTGMSATGSSNVFLGNKAGKNETGSNMLYLENSDSTTPLIYGEFDNDKIVINGEFQATGITRDSGGDEGTSGQVLSSTVTGTNWIDAASGATEINDLTDGKTEGYSVFLGSGAGNNDDGSNNWNVGVGYNALYQNSIGEGNIALGWWSLYYNTGSQNIAIGHNSQNSNRGGQYNTCIGGETNFYNMTGSQNTIIGYKAGKGSSLHDKSGNVFLGYMAGYNENGNNKLYIANTSGTPLIYGAFDIDYIAINGDLRVTGEFRDSYGDAGISGQVLSSTSSGSDWIDSPGALEVDDLTDGKTGGGSVFIGSSAGYNDDGSSNHNIGIGSNALYNNFSGNTNIALGLYTLYNNSGSYNIAIGGNALNRNTSGEHNLGIGEETNCFNQTGSQNTIIGYKAGRGSSLHNKSGNIFLGYHAGYNETEDDKLYIENSDSSTPLIGGDFSTDKVTINDVLILTPRSTPPTDPINGEIYVGTDNHIYCYLNSAWKQLDN